MFERFTERARQVVVLAQQEARALRHGQINTDHLLLGLMMEGEGVAARVLAQLKFDADDLREALLEDTRAAPTLPSGQLPFTEKAKKALELSLREALGLGHNYIGTEHILLGLLRDPDNSGARFLLDTYTEEEIRNAVIQAFVGSGRKRDRTLREARKERADRLDEALSHIRAASVLLNPEKDVDHELLTAVRSDTLLLRDRVLNGELDD